MVLYNFDIYFVVLLCFKRNYLINITLNHAIFILAYGTPEWS